MSARAGGVGDIAGLHYAHINLIAHAAATATEKVGIWIAPAAVNVVGIKICPALAATGDNTNRTNYNFIDMATGAGTTEVANHDYATGTDAVAGTSVSLTVTTFAMAAGDALGVEAEKVASGLALGPTAVEISFRYA